MGNVEYSMKVLQDHQNSCGPLSVVGDGDDFHIACEGCGMSVYKGDGSAVFKLKGYDIELV